VSITITDPKELDLPNIGMAQFDDPETGKTFNLDTSNETLRRSFRENALKITGERKKTFDRLGVDSVDIRCDIPYNRTLFKFFRVRERRLR
jgi:hypothetical protein